MMNSMRTKKSLSDDDVGDSAVDRAVDSMRQISSHCSSSTLETCTTESFTDSVEPHQIPILLIIVTIRFFPC